MINLKLGHLPIRKGNVQNGSGYMWEGMGGGRMTENVS